MKWFYNLKIGAKVGCLVALMIISNLLTTVVGKSVQDTLLQQADDMYQRNLIAVQLLDDCSKNSLRITSFIHELFASGDPKVIQNNLKEMARLGEDNGRIFIELHGLLTEDYEHEQLEKIKQVMESANLTGQKSVALILKGQLREGYIYYQKEVAPHVQDINILQAELSKHIKQQAANSKSDFKEIQSKLVIFTLGMNTIATVLTILLAWYIKKLVSQPASELVIKVKEIAAGNLAGTSLLANSHDEFGLLAGEINSMSHCLKDLVKQAGRSAGVIASAAEQLVASMNQSSQASNQVANSIAEVAQGAEAQLDAMNKVSQIIEKMVTGIQEVATNANSIADVAQEAALSARNGEISIDKVMNQMSNIEQSVDGLEHNVSKLSERSREIGQIVAAISNIAGQTNLLALNAAIEAARAGDQGKGFAVVAEEVRRLAEQSQNAAKQIASIIEEIQSDTMEAVVSMASGIKEVKLGMEIVEESGEEFKEIAGLVAALAGQTQVISMSSQQLVTSSQQISSTVKEVDSLSKVAASEAESVSAATQEQSAAMEEIVTSAQALLEVAEQLKKDVLRFKV